MNLGSPASFCKSDHSHSYRRSKQTTGQGETIILGNGRIGATTGTATTPTDTSSRTFLTRSTTTHSVLSCIRPGVKVSRICWMIPYPPPMSSPLGARGTWSLLKMVMKKMDMMTTFIQQTWSSPHQSCSFYIAKNVKINNINILNVLNISVITATYQQAPMHQVSDCPECWSWWLQP